MKSKRQDCKRRLSVEPLERRELLAADLACQVAIPPEATGSVNTAMVQQQAQLADEASVDSTLQRRDRSEASSGIGALERPRDRTSQDAESALTSTLAASQLSDDPPQERQRTDEDNNTGVGRQKRPRDRDDEDVLSSNVANATLEVTALNAWGNRGTQADPVDGLSEEEATSLLFIREEEKLARDVYITLGERWNLPIFANIAESEQRHMDAVGQLIEKYGLEDPVTEDTVGVFSNPDLRTLYDGLVSDGVLDLGFLDLDLGIQGGAASQLAALKVGAFIEELDILDLRDAVANTTHSDVENVYENLLRGSRSHLRSFVGQIEASGDTYEPVLMTGDLYPLYQEIISGDQETANGNSRGSQRRGGRRF
jgi:hypothetical protein